MGLPFVSLCGAGDQTRGFLYARQTRCQRIQPQPLYWEVENMTVTLGTFRSPSVADSFFPEVFLRQGLAV